MGRPSLRRAGVAVLLALGVGAADAQNVVTPPPGPNPDIGCLVQGLDPNGDGFLALRAGPGTSHPKIGELRNGDAAYLARVCTGGWCYVENGAIGGREARFRGWIYDAWCEFYP